MDIFATAAGAAGAPLPTDRPIDGVDLTPFLVGAADTTLERLLYWRSGRYQMLLKDGWKLQVAQEPAKTWLFDLNTDPTERTNLAEQRPDKVREAHNGHDPLMSLPYEWKEPLLDDDTTTREAQPASTETAGAGSTVVTS